MITSSTTSSGAIRRYPNRRSLASRVCWCPCPSGPPYGTRGEKGGLRSRGWSQTPPPPRTDTEVINLIQSAGPAVAKRLAPVAAILLAAILLFVLRRRR